MQPPATQVITRLLQDLHLGQPSARERLWEAVYQELHSLAQAHMAREANGRTLQATALVHEAYLRLIEGGDGVFENRGHFFAAAATAMRRILVDDARRRGRVKRGGGAEPPGPTSAHEVPRQVARHRRVELADCAAQAGPDPADLLAVDEVMAALEREHPLLARVVELRFYGGLSGDQTAEVMEISPRAVDNYWRAARAWLYGKLA